MRVRVLRLESHAQQFNQSLDRVYFMLSLRSSSRPDSSDTGEATETETSYEYERNPGNLTVYGFCSTVFCSGPCENPFS